MHTKKSLGILAIAILGCLIFILPASASPILLTYSGPGSATVNLPLVNPYNGSYNLNVYAYPYYLSAVPSMCDDAQTDVNAGLKWWANVHFIPQDLTAMKWYSEFTNPSDALLAYEEAAIIFYEGATGSGSNPVADGGSGASSAEGNVAVWWLFSHPPQYTGQWAVASTPEIQAIVTAAASVVATGTFDYSKVVFFTPDPSLALNPPAGGLSGGLGASQEFIALEAVESRTLPEPATYALFGVGLLSLGWLGRRLRRA
ncbi:MAG: PEP-CTERM sorting domain-containing protein [Bryobacteraceae bacterium]|jgi:hypothetical protein